MPNTSPNQPQHASPNPSPNAPQSPLNAMPNTMPNTIQSTSPDAAQNTSQNAAQSASQARSLLLGHALAIFTIFVWGGTFSATKILLQDFAAAEILLLRFLVAFIFLCVLCYALHIRALAWQGLGREWLFMGAGLSGACLYFLVENIALSHTSAANASILVSISPIFTAILCFALYGKRLKRLFVLGFVLAVAGIFLVVQSGGLAFSVSLFGDMLCVLAGLIWSIYTIILQRIFALYRGVSHLAITRKIFLYGVIFTLPFGLGSADFSDLSRFFEMRYLVLLAFLGLVASALCYLSWNASLKRLGIIKASAYIYAIPVVGVLIATIWLGENLNAQMILGGALVLLGLFLSQK